jgi:plastocyanin
MDRHPFGRVASLISRNSKPLVTAVAAVAIALVLGVTTGAAGNGRTVKSEGDEQFVPNAKIQATLKFAPGRISIKSGETLTFEHGDRTQDPHTLSIVNKDEVPASIDDVFNCGAPGTVCSDVFNQFPGEPTGPMFVDATGTDAGIDGRLDTLFITPGGSISAPVTAPSGSTLYFICAIHPWMQGEIDVN